MIKNITYLNIMETIKKFLPLIGRVLIAAIFLLSAYNKIIGFEATAQFISKTILPWPTAATIIAIIIEGVGGLMILVGLKTRLAASVMFLFLIVVNFVFNFNLSDNSLAMNFVKDAAIIGGLMYIAAFGAGNFALDKE